ncbi:MAG: helix-turn-helix domain-containing protein [Bdellovibrionota bacterium]
MDNNINEITSNIFDLINKGESEIVEFKESFGEDAIETVSAFANARGGSIFIGIKDSGVICGIQIGTKTIEDIANRIQDATDPRMQPSITFFSEHQKTVIMIKVSQGSGAPISARGRYFRRVGKTNQRMSHEEIMQKMIASTGLSWDTVIDSSSKYEDLDPDRINRFIQTIKKLGRQPIPEQILEQEFLRKIELIRDCVPTRAALLLFAKNTDTYFPSAFLKIGRFRSPTNIVDDREVHGTLFDQLDGAMSWFRERLETKFLITGNPEREVQWEYPLSAIREAVINVLCHRDYTSLAHSQIRLYDDHLEIWNAGGLPCGLTTEMLLTDHDSIPRNRKIAQAFFLSGLIERWGSGTTRMNAELQDAGFPAPKFESQADRFRLFFYRKIPTENYLLKEGLSEREILVISYAKEHGSISNSEYQKITGVSKRTASRELNELKIKDIFIVEGTTGKGTIYRLK